MATDPIAPRPRQRIIRIAGAILAISCLPSCLDPIRKPIPPLHPPEPTAETKELAAIPVQPGTVTRMPLGTLYQLVQGEAALIYDVRPSIIYQLGHIPGAISFPKSTFDRDLGKHEPQIRAAIKNQKPVVIYCTDLACPDAITVANQLAERGYSVSVLQGGYDAWKSATN